MMSICVEMVIETAGESEQPADLAIGSCPSICRNRLGDLLLRFARAWPGVDLGVQELPRRGLLTALRSGRLALAVLPGELQPGLASLPLWTDSVVIAVARDHPLAQEARITPAQLRDEVVLMPRAAHGSEPYRFLAESVAPFGPSLNGFLTDLSVAQVTAQVAAGAGATLVCASEADLSPDIVTRPIAASGVSFPVFAYWRDQAPEWPLSALVETLGEAARQVGRL